MFAWPWIIGGLFIIILMYGFYVLGFVHGSDHASAVITNELINWTGQLEEKINKDEIKKL